MTDTIAPELEDIETKTKKGFDVLARMQNRGLRRGVITLFLDEDKGVELGWAYDLKDTTGTITIRRMREGLVGELDQISEEHEKLVADKTAAIAAARAAEEKTSVITALEKALASVVEVYTGREAELNKQIAALTEELHATGLTINLRAVPPIIQKNTRRQAKEKMGITEKNVPEDKQEEFNLCQLAFLMTVMFQSVTDNSTGDVNTETTYDDAMALMDYLPVGQFQRLNDVMGRVQFSDAISRSIEGQEDFS